MCQINLRSLNSLLNPNFLTHGKNINASFCFQKVYVFPEETASSSESERETDSSEHNGMTESMWTESETGNNLITILIV